LAEDYRTAADPEADLRAALEAMDLSAVHTAAEVIGEVARGPDEDFQLSALGFRTNVCGLWTTAYTALALEAIRAEGKPPQPPTSPASHQSGSITSTC
jgi:hypothetical protein